MRTKSHVPVWKNICTNVPTFVSGDPYRFQQVMINLVSNAVKFTQRGHISVEVQYLSEEVPTLQVVVHDTGVGIEEQIQLFVPWKQADPSDSRQHGGSGLGLCITKKLVELMGGKIWYTSRPGEGSSFYFTVQLQPSDGAEIALNTQRDTMTPASFGQSTIEQMDLNILIAEDNTTNQLVLVRCLEKLGISKQRMKIVGDGQQAVSAVQKKTFDIVFMDLNMPKLNGIDATSRIRADPKNCRTFVVAVTGTDAVNRTSCTDLGIDAVLRKPFQLWELSETLESFLRNF